MSKKILLVVICCSILATVGVKAVISQRTPQHAPYTIVWRSIVQEADGRIEQYYTETRYVSSNRNWRAIKEFPDGHKEEAFAEVGRGVFALKPDQQKMHFLSEHAASNFDPEKIRQGAQYVRTENVLGMTAYVQRVQSDNVTLEVYRAPALNGDMIKYVQTKDGASTVFEPVSITLGEPGAEKLAHREYPVDYKINAQTHGSGTPPQER
jgi:hypothetical protein